LGGYFWRLGGLLQAMTGFSVVITGHYGLVGGLLRAVRDITGYFWVFSEGGKARNLLIRHPPSLSWLLSAWLVCVTRTLNIQSTSMVPSKTHREVYVFSFPNASIPLQTSIDFSSRYFFRTSTASPVQPSPAQSSPAQSSQVRPSPAQSSPLQPSPAQSSPFQPSPVKP
jgi:hypothetical protein